MVDVESRRVDRKNVEYLVLEPQGQPGTRYLVPSGNPNALAKLRPLMSREELDQLLLSEAVRRDHWISEENPRKQYYRELIASGDRTALLQMLRSVNAHKRRQEAAGKKLHICDENFVKDAQRLLDAEFAIILDIPQDQVRDYVTKKLQ